MTGILLTIAAAYALVLAFLFAFQRRLIYHPNRRIGPPDEYGLAGFSEAFATTADGISIQLWRHAPAKGFPTIVYYHGNAYHMGNRADIYAALAEKGFGILAVSYRGYGKSGGSPSEQGLYNDARAAIGLLLKEGLASKHILLFGESLGTGVAVQMATEYDVGGLILQSPYLSVARRAAEIYRYVPVMLMIRDIFDSMSKIAKVKAPLLVFHGELDLTIPIAHGRALFEAATVAKRACFFPIIAHNDFDTAAISSHVLDFAKEHHLIEA